MPSGAPSRPALAGFGRGNASASRGIARSGVRTIADAGRGRGQLAESGAGGLPRPPGRKPSGRGAATRSARPHPQAGTPRRNAHPMTATARTGPAVLLAPGILSPRKITDQGRTSSLRCGRSTLTLIFHGKTRHLSGGRGK
jgi:hypothetical protein